MMCIRPYTPRTKPSMLDDYLWFAWVFQKRPKEVDKERVVAINMLVKIHLSDQPVDSISRYI